MKNRVKIAFILFLLFMCLICLIWGLNNNIAFMEQGSGKDNQEFSEEIVETITSETESTWPVVYSDEEFTRLIAENPIDKYFPWEMVKNRESITMSQYRIFWRMESENALEILEEYLTEQDYEELKQAHESWTEYTEYMDRMEWRQIMEEPQTEFGGADQTHEREAERERNHAIELMSLEYAFTGTVKFHKETARWLGWNRTDTQVGFWTEDYGIDRLLPEELFEELAASLKEGSWEEKLEELSIEYQVLGEEEKKELVRAAEGYNGLAEYCQGEPMYLEDPWYVADLSENGKDLVIDSYDMEGEPCIHYYENILNSQVYTEPPISMNGNRNGAPYFIKWEGTPYMAIPVWDEESEELTGIEVYYGNRGGVVTGIWINGKGEGGMKSQQYITTDPQYPPENGEFYPTVLPGSEKE